MCMIYIYTYNTQVGNHHACTSNWRVYQVMDPQNGQGWVGFPASGTLDDAEVFSLIVQLGLAFL